LRAGHFEPESQPLGPMLCIDKKARTGEKHEQQSTFWLANGLPAGPQRRLAC
jgi:hypothetical protein